MADRRRARRGRRARLRCASLVAGFLFWPRGAAAALGTAYAEAYGTSAEYLRESVDSSPAALPIAPPDMRRRSSAASARLDDALRQYLAEQGAKHVPLESVTALADGATRLRLAGTAIDRPGHDVPGHACPRWPTRRSTGRSPRCGDRTNEVTSWYAELADVLDGVRDRRRR